MRALQRVLPALVFLLFTFTTSGTAQSQDPVVLQLQPESKLWIDGTSSRDDWTVHAGAVNGSVTLTDAMGVSQVEVTVPARQIVSNKSTIMDRLMYTALKESDHPTITFVLDEPVAGSPSGNSYTLNTSGRLTLAGETRDIQMNVTGERLDDGSVRFTGSYPMKMTDFGITPPTAMFGALRTGDDVTVHFDVVAAAN